MTSRGNKKLEIVGGIVMICGFPMLCAGGIFLNDLEYKYPRPTPAERQKLKKNGIILLIFGALFAVAGGIIMYKFSTLQ